MVPRAHFDKLSANGEQPEMRTRADPRSG